MENSTITSQLVPLLERLRSVVTRLIDKPLRVENQMEYAAIVQCVESSLLTMREEEWKISVSVGIVSELLTFAVGSVVDHPLSCVAIQSWEKAMEVLLTRKGPNVNASHHVPELWNISRRLVKETSSNKNKNSASLQAVLTLLRVILKRCPVIIDCTPRYHLPHPVKTVDVGSRLAALELIPYIILQPQHYHQDKEQQQQQKEYDEHIPQRPILSTSWLEYLRKAVNCSVPVVQEKAVEVICVLLKEGVILGETHTTVMLDMVLHLARGDNISPRLQKNVGTLIGCLLVTFQRGTNWAHFAATNAVDSTRIIGRLFQPLTMTHMMQRVLSIAVKELLLQTVSTEWIGEAMARVFELLQPIPHDDRTYMPTIVSRAVSLWTVHMGSDMLRVALVKFLAKFLDASCEKVVTHTALLCLIDVIRTTFVSSEYAPSLWTQFLQIPARHVSLMKVTSKAMACLAERSEMCGRTLLLSLYTVSGEIEHEKSLSPFFMLHAKALLAMPAKFLRQLCVLETLLAVVASLSIEGPPPPPKLEGIFLQRVEYFNRFVLLLLEHQRDRLSSATVTNIKISVRILLNLLVNAPSGTSLYARATSSACTVLVKLGASDIELKLVSALVKIIDAANAVGGSMGRSMRVAVYRVLSCAPCSACSDDINRQLVITRALADVAEANRDGVPCAIATKEQIDLNEVELIQLFDVAPECFNNCYRLVPMKVQKEQAYATQSAIGLIVSCCIGTTGKEYVQLVFHTLREWRAAADGNSAVTAWNILCCLNGIFAGSDNNSDGGCGWVVEEAMEWIRFVELYWLSSGMWAVRYGAATLLARLAVITAGRDEFTSTVVKKYDANVNANLLSGVLLALGEIHSTDNSTTAPMATSFILSMLKQHMMCNNKTVVVTAALTAMIRMMPRHAQLVETVVSTAFVPYFLMPATSTTRPGPFILTHLLKLFSLMLVQPHSIKNDAMYVCIRGVVYATLSCRELSEEATCVTLNIVRSIVNDFKQKTMGTAEAAESVCVSLLDPVVIQRRVFELLKNNVNTSDLISRAAASLLMICWRSVDNVTPHCESLLYIAPRIDAAASPETRDVWVSAARNIIRLVDHNHAGLYQQEMELIIRGKPAQPRDLGNVKCSGVKKGDGEEGKERLSLYVKKSNGMNSGGVVEENKEVTSEVASKLAVLTLMTEMMQHSEIFLKLGNDALERHLHLLCCSVSMAEVVSNFVCPAANALLLIVEKYGHRVKGVSTPFLLPWKVMLVNGIRSVIQRSIFCYKESCVLAEKFIECNLADDNSVRRIVQALATLLEGLERCNRDYDAIGHGGCGRVVLTLSVCRTRAVDAQWFQAEECASEIIGSPSGQAAVALLCNQLVTSMALVHCFEPTHDMMPTPLDDCMHATPTAVLHVLNNMSCTVSTLGPTLRHAAGCLLSMMLCTPNVPLHLMRDVIPLLSTNHQKLIMNTAFELLMQETDDNDDGGDLLSDEDAGELLEIVAITTCEKSKLHVEFILLSMATRRRPCVGSLAALRLAVEASCSTKCVNAVLHSLHVDMLMVSGDELMKAAAAYMHNLSIGEWKNVALGSASGFLLAQLTNHANKQQNQLLSGYHIEEAALSRLAEALVQTSDSLALLQRVFPNMHEDMNLCSTILALCSSAQRPELQKMWSSCIQHALLSFIHSETLLQERCKPFVLERITIFVRSLLMLVQSFPSTDIHGSVKVIHSTYPNACTALTQKLMRDHVSELKSAIQSLDEEEAAILRSLIQLQSSGTVPRASSIKMETRLQKNSTTRAVPERLTINVASFTQS